MKAPKQVGTARCAVRPEPKNPQITREDRVAVIRHNIDALFADRSIAPDKNVITLQNLRRQIDNRIKALTEETPAA